MMTAGDLNSVKETPLAWLPKCPSHWDFVRAKAIFRRMQRSVRPEDGVVTAFRDGIVTLRSNRRTTGFTEALQEIGYQGIRKGDLVIHAMDAFAGAIGVSDSDGKGTPVYSVCQPTGDANSWYYALVLREMSRSGYLLSLAKGIRERSTDFRFADFASLMVPLPPVEEQEQIVRFVRQLDSRVNRLIKAKRRLIELLNEQKQAIIHQAVTRGLDPTVPLKPSGIDWLGDIPEHWEVRRLRFLARMGTGARDTVHRKDDGMYPFVVRSQTLEQIDSYSFDGEAVLTAGDGAGVAKVFHYLNGKFDYHQRVYAFHHFRHVTGRFFFYYFSNSLRFEALAGNAKSTVDSLRLPMLQNFPVPLPPKSEQEAIVSYIDLHTRRLERAISKANAEIDLIREYRTRLVADVVTGQLDVRQHPWATTEIEDPTEAITDEAELEDDLEETDDVLEEAGV